MATTIKLKNSVTTTNTPTSLAQGEVAINITDKKVWVGNAATTPVQLLGAGSSGTFGALTCTSLTDSGLTSGRVTYATTGGLLTDSAGLTFDGTNFTTTGTATATRFIPSGSTVATNGMYLPAANSIGISTNSTNAIYIDSSQNVGIGTSSPTRKFVVYGNSAQVDMSIVSSTTGISVLQMGDTAADNQGQIIYRNSTDSMEFAANGAERMRIDSSGNVGIGTSSPASRLNIAFSSSTAYASGSTGNGLTLYNSSATNNQYVGIWFRGEPSSGNEGQATIYGTTTSGGNMDLTFSTRGSGTLAERMRITSGGNVGIGTTSPTEKLIVNGAMLTTGQLGALTASSFCMDWNTGSALARLIATGADASTYAPIIFANSTTTTYAERMRITSGGAVLIGTTSNANTSKLKVNAGGDYAIETVRSGTSTATQVIFVNDNGIVGQISTSGSATSYVTSSDYRLKENIAPMTGALAKVQALKPVTYTWKVDGSAGQGFIAHELAEIVPDCVTGEKDAIDKNGKPIYQGIDVSFLVATLTAAIQELNAKVEAQAAEIALLKSK